MHEYSLHGQAASSRHTQLLHVLAGISAMSPMPIFERHLVFRPTVIPTRQAAQVGGSQAIQDAAKAARQAQAASTDVYYVKLVEVLGIQIDSANVEPEQQDMDMNGEHDEASMKVEDESSKMVNSDSKPAEIGSTSRWQMVFHDVPEPGARPVTARMTTITPLEEGNAIDFMEGLGYTFVMPSMHLSTQIEIILTHVTALQICDPVSSAWPILHISGRCPTLDPYIDATRCTSSTTKAQERGIRDGRQV